MRSACLVTLVAVVGISACAGAESSWTGKISDSMCGAQHKAAAEHSERSLSDADCTAACVKNGAQYVFVSRGKVYKIVNQDFAGLKQQAGRPVRVTGEMTGETIKISKIAVAIKEHQGEKSSL